MSTERINAFRMPVQTRSLVEQGYRVFIVTDPDQVELPNCVAINEVLLNGVGIPPIAVHTVPTDTTHSRFKDLELPNFTVIEGPTGVPILLRSLNCNDGKWQVGATLHIRGEWSDEEPAKPAQTETTAPKADADLKLPDLIKLANENGGTFPAVGTKKDDVVAFLTEKGLLGQ